MSDQPSRSPRRDLAAHYESAYESTPPWDIGAPQTGFAELVEKGRLRGRVLDVGCGTGEHALMAAAAGCEVVGIDIAAAAIRLAEGKAAERGLRARFLVGDARHLEDLGEQFDAVLDCGLFHVFEDEDRPTFVESLAQVVRAGGRYFMLCFSDDEPGDWGPRRVTRDEIREMFTTGWDIESIEPTELQVTIRPEPVRAWSAVIRRT